MRERLFWATIIIGVTRELPFYVTVLLLLMKLESFESILIRIEPLHRTLIYLAILDRID